SRPAATTRPAPWSFAACTASRPVTPVAPSTRTVSPGRSSAPWASDSHAETPGFGNAAAVTSSSASGTGISHALGAGARSAMAPYGARRTEEDPFARGGTADAVHAHDGGQHVVGRVVPAGGPHLGD